MNKLLRIDPETVEKISHQKRIIGFRNILIHGYNIVEDAVVWDVIQKNLPILHDEVVSLLES